MSELWATNSADLMLVLRAGPSLMLLQGGCCLAGMIAVYTFGSWTAVLLWMPV